MSDLGGDILEALMRFRPVESDISKSILGSKQGGRTLYTSIPSDNVEASMNMFRRLGKWLLTPRTLLDLKNWLLERRTPRDFVNWLTGLSVGDANMAAFQKQEAKKTTLTFNDGTIVMIIEPTGLLKPRGRGRPVGK